MKIIASGVSFIYKMLSHGGAWLAISAVISKALGLLRDRLLVQLLPDSALLDSVYAAFRIPDFFYFLLISGTVASLYLPKIQSLKETDKAQYHSSFFWLIALGFGGICLLAIMAMPWLIPLFFPGLDPNIIAEMVPLSRILCGSVWVLSLSSLFLASHQSASSSNKYRLLPLAIAPVVYSGVICAGLFWLSLSSIHFSLSHIGYFVSLGSGLHCLLSALWHWRSSSSKIHLCYMKPVPAWRGFWTDAGRRISTSAVFQIAWTLDLTIASMLTIGSITATTLGINTGHFLLSIIGFSVANAVFPRLTSLQNNIPAQSKMLSIWSKRILLLTIFPSILCALFAPFLLQFLFDLTPETLRLTSLVFIPSVLSLPFACIIPVWSRAFLANDDTKTPLKVSVLSLGISMLITILLCFFVLPPHLSPLGIGLGTALANMISALGYLFYWKQRAHSS